MFRGLIDGMKNNAPTGLVWCWTLLLGGFLGWMGISAAAGAPAPEVNPNSTDMLQVGDVLKISLSGVKEVDEKPPSEQKIKEDGTITLDYIGSVKASGKTVAQLEKDILAAYVPKYYKRLTVAITADNRFYYVGGEVKSPNRYPHVSELTVTKAIDSAGGFTDFAKKSKVTLTRLNGTVETIDCEKALKNSKLDLPVYPGDKIHVPRRYLF